MTQYMIQRFLVPPFILAFLIIVAVVLDPELSIEQWFKDLSVDFNLAGAVVSFFAISAAIYAAGFIITNVLIFFLRAISWLSKKPSGFSISWSKESEKVLKKLYVFKSFEAEAEQCEQCFLGQVASQHVRDWLRGRWEYYTSNSNCAFACLIAIILVVAIGINPPYWWYIVAAFLIISFSYNAYKAWRECMDLDNFLVRNLDSFKKLKEHQQESTIHNTPESR